MKQITREQAILIGDSKEWESWTDEEIVKFQLYQDRLCIPLDRFHQAIEVVLKRQVYFHEFRCPDRLLDEYLKKAPPPTFQEIIDLCPQEKLIVINRSSSDDKEDVPPSFQECDI